MGKRNGPYEFVRKLNNSEVEKDIGACVRAQVEHKTEPCTRPCLR